MNYKITSNDLKLGIKSVCRQKDCFLWRDSWINLVHCCFFMTQLSYRDDISLCICSISNIFWWVSAIFRGRRLYETYFCTNVFLSHFLKCFMFLQTRNRTFWGELKKKSWQTAVGFPLFRIAASCLVSLALFSILTFQLSCFKIFLKETHLSRCLPTKHRSQVKLILWSIGER